MKNLAAGLSSCGCIIKDSIFKYILSYKKMYNTDGKYQLLNNIPLTFNWQISTMYLEI